MPMYCPAGDGEFDDWIVRCPECGQALVPNPASASDNRPSRVVHLTTAPNEPQAQMWADVLRGEGIAVFVQAGGPGIGAWGSAASFEHTLSVKQEDLRRARKLVRTLLSETDSWSGALPRRTEKPRVRHVQRPR